MPYTMSNKPDKIKDLPKKAKIIWLKAFNSAYYQYLGDEAGYQKGKDGTWWRWE
jgi:cation transport regulator ChaB